MRPFTARKFPMSVAPALAASQFPNAQQIAALALLFALIAFALLAFRRRDRQLAAGMDRARHQVLELYRSTVIPAEEPRFAFDGSTATVIDDQELPGSDSDGEYSLTRYARNPEGEYFMLMFEVKGGTPRLVFAKLVEQHIARVVLKDKYVPPPLV